MCESHEVLAAPHRVLEVGESALGRRALQLCARRTRRRAIAAWVGWLHARARPRAALRHAAAAHFELATRCRAWRVRHVPGFHGRMVAVWVPEYSECAAAAKDIAMGGLDAQELAAAVLK